MVRQRLYSDSNDSKTNSDQSNDQSNDRSNERSKDPSNKQSADHLNGLSNGHSTKPSDNHSDSLKVWLNPSSPYRRVFLLLIFCSIFITTIHNVFKRMSCTDPPADEEGTQLTRLRIYLLRGLAASLTLTIPTGFISVFVWHFAFDIKSDLNPFRRSCKDGFHDHIDLSRFRGVRDLFNDVRHQLLPKKGSIKHADPSVQTDDHVLDVSTNVKHQACIHGGSNTDPSSNESSSTDNESKSHDSRFNEMVAPTAQTRTACCHDDVISAPISQPAIKAGCHYPIQPLLWLITPRSIYGLILRHQIVDWYASLLFATPWNFTGYWLAVSDSSPLSLFVKSIMGVPPTQLITFADAIQLAGEYLLIPLFYRKHLHRLRRSHKLSKKPRSVMWTVLIPLFFIMAQWYDGSTNCFFFCTYFPNFFNLITTALFPSYASKVALFCVLAVVLLIDEVRHFSGTEAEDHHQCPCRVWYLMLLVLLISVSAGFAALLLSTWYRLFQMVRAVEDLASTEQMMFHMLFILWQMIVSQVALRALLSTSADAVLFPVQLLDDVVGWSYFLYVRLFSASFFLSLSIQLCKPVVRDLNCVSRLFETGRRAVLRFLGCRPAVVSREATRRKWQSRHLMRYQSFMAEICGKCIMITVLIVDTIPMFSDSPPAFIPCVTSIGSCTNDSEYTVQDDFIGFGVLVGLAVVHCLMHVMLLRVIDRMDGGEAHDVHDLPRDMVHSDRSSFSCRSQAARHLSHQEVFDSHWTRHYFFWLLCVFKLVTIILEFTQIPYNHQIFVGNCAQSIFGVQGRSPFVYVYSHLATVRIMD